MNITDTTVVVASTATSALVTNPIVATSTHDSTPVLTIVGALLLTAVSTLGMVILSWYFKHCYCWFCCCFKRADNRNNNNNNNNDDHDHDHDHNYDHDHDHEQSHNQDLEEGGRREGHCDNENDSDTASTIPSIVTIISRSSISTDLRWGRRSRSQGTRAAAAAAAAAAYNKQASGSFSPTANGRRFLRRNSNSNSNRQQRRRRRRHWRGRPSFGAPRSPATYRTNSIGTSPTGNNFFDHTTILTSSCDDMSLPDEECGIDVVNRTSVDPPGSRFDKEAVDDSYPNATIQFRNPINGNNDSRFLLKDDDDDDDDDEEIDLLVDFLVHTEDYVRYPRSKLTILLRARVPETEEDRERLQHLRTIIEDASSTTLASALELESASSPPSSGSENCTEQQQQQQQRPPLQVCITTTTSGNSSVSSEEDLLRCAPTGGFLVTFGSVWELPEDHPDFLKDLVV